MQKEKTTQKEKIKRIKKKKYILHYLIVYHVCLLVACVTWLSVRYSMQENAETPYGNDPSPAQAMETVGTSTENLLYV